MTRLDPSARVRNHIADVLTSGPIAFDALLDTLVDRGLALGPEPDERLDAVLEYMNGVSLLTVSDPDNPDELVALIYDRRSLLNQTTWTIPLTALDLESDTLSSDAIGLMFMVLVNGWATLEGADPAEHIRLDTDGQRRQTAPALGLDHEAESAVVLPTGWLASLGAQPGDFLQLQTDDDVVHATILKTAPEPTDEMVEALVDVMSSGLDDGFSRSVSMVLLELLATHETLRTIPLPPLVALFDAAGLERSGAIIAPPGHDFAMERLAEQIEDGLEMHGLKGQDAQSFTTLITSWHHWFESNRGATEVSPTTDDSAADPATAQSLDTESLAPAAKALSSIPVARAFADVALADDRADELIRFCELLIDAAVGHQKAGPAWLIAHTLGVVGDTAGFEDWLDTAIEFDGGHFLSVYDKSWFEFDRSEWRKAKALLTKLGAPPDFHDLKLIEQMLNSSGPTVGRNDPCPCGSGRKYKRCHAGIDEIPLRARLTALYRKSNKWLEVRHNRDVHLHALIRAQHTDMSPAEMLETDPLIADSVLTEDGLFDEWLTERGALLPSDEAMLAEQWALAERSVFEVTDVRVDEGLTLRDVRTGDVVDVTERLGTQGMKTGRYILARPLPVGGDERQIFGGVTLIPDHALHSFIELLDSEPTALQLLSLVAKTEGPPELRNTDGDEMVMCETTWDVGESGGARQILDDTFEPVVSGDPADPNSTAAKEWSWLAPPDGRGGGSDAMPDWSDTPDDGRITDDGRTVLGTLTLAGDHLVVSTNSIERAERAAELIGSLFPDAAILEELQSSLDDLREDTAYERYVFEGEVATDTNDRNSSGLMDIADASPEIQDAVRQMMNQHEERWVDESIPALGGATPRQALDDPTRREDLFRLLDRMEEMEKRLPIDQAGFGMRTSRLRELLGL